jgi:hypothetical protein
MPNDAKCRTTRNAERRKVPNDARCRTTQGAERRKVPNGADELSAPLAHLAFRALRHFALFGISRSLAFGAVRHLAPFGISRR